MCVWSANGGVVLWVPSARVAGGGSTPWSGVYLGPYNFHDYGIADEIAELGNKKGITFT